MGLCPQPSIVGHQVYISERLFGQTEVALGMATNYVPSFGDLDQLTSGDKAKDTLEAYEGYGRWEGESEESMLFTVSDGQAARQGIAYVGTLGLAALHSRIRRMHVYGTDEKLRKSLEIAHKLHGQMTIVTLCSVAKEHKFTVDRVKNQNHASRMTYWIWLKKVK